MSNELTVIDEKETALQRVPISIEEILLKAIEEKTPIEVMERLLAMKEKIEADRAKKAYFEAYAAFQTECPVLKKTKTVMNKDRSTIRYRYAPFEDVVKQVVPILSSHGFTYRFVRDIDLKEKIMYVTCIGTHELGHSEQSTFPVPIMGSDFMNVIQEYGTADTYGKRYAFNDLWGLAADEDTDVADIARGSEEHGKAQRRTSSRPAKKDSPTAQKTATNGDSEVSNDSWFAFLRCMGDEKKRIGEDAYYRVLFGEFAYEHANLVPRDHDKMTEVYRAMKEVEDEV